MTQTRSKFGVAKSLIHAFANQGMEPAITILNTYDEIKELKGDILAARYIIDVHDTFHLVLDKTANVG